MATQCKQRNSAWVPLSLGERGDKAHNTSRRESVGDPLSQKLLDMHILQCKIDHNYK